ATEAAAADATGGDAWSKLTLMNTQAALAWGPWALATALPNASSSSPGRLRALSGGALVGLTFLAGEPVVTGLVALAWAVVAVASHRPVPTGWLAKAALAATAVAAPVLFPLLAVLGDTVRGALGVAPGALGADALAPRRVLELALPRLLGNPLGDAESGFWAAASFPWQRYFPLLFLSALPVLLLPLARRSPRQLAPWWWLAASGLAGAGLLALGPLAALAGALPGFGGARYAIKLLLLTTLALPPLLAAGAEELARSSSGTGRRLAAVVLALTALLTGVGTATERLLRPLLGAFYPDSRTALAAVPGGELRRAVWLDCLALALPPAVVLATPAAVPLAAATLAANTLGGAGLLAFDESERWRQPPAAIAALPAGATIAAFVASANPATGAGDAALDRFWRHRAALFPQYATRWGFRYLLSRGPDGLEPLRHEALAAAAARLPVDERARVARALGATAVLTASPLAPASREVDGVWLTTWHEQAAEAYLARRLVCAEGPLAVAQALAAEQFRPGEDAVIAGAGGARDLLGGEVTGLDGPPHHRRWAVRSRGAGLLVVRQSSISSWRARVDGAPAEVEAVNGAQLGVRVPAGVHLVELRIDPTPYALGGLVLGIFAVACWLWPKVKAGPVAKGLAGSSRRVGAGPRSPGPGALSF
ncbi:MAG: hypothetical protein V1750_10100, partial [Acidobacteriota bacterium]